MREQECIHVVVPVYNAEKLLDRCINSLVSQSYRNIKIYLVDDCSTDSSPDKCEVWADRDNRIQLMRQKENKGSAAARNAGLNCIDYSSGYVAFVDIDDYVHPDYFQLMYDSLIKNDADIVWVSNQETHQIEVADYEKLYQDTVKEEIFTSKQVLMKEEWRIMYSMLWGKLYKAWIWEDIRLPESCRYFQDGATTFKALYKAKKIVKSSIKPYYYYYSKDSETRSAITEEKCRNGLFTATEKIDFYTKQGETELLEMAYVGYVNTILKNIHRSAYCENPKVLRKEMKKLYRENYKRVVRNKGLSRAQRVKYIIYRVMPDSQKYYIKLKMKLRGNVEE